MSWSGFTRRARNSSHNTQTQLPQDVPDMPFDHAVIDLMFAFPKLESNEEASKYLEMVIDGPKTNIISNDQLQQAKTQVANKLLYDLTGEDTDLAGKYLHEAKDNSVAAYETAMKDKEFIFKLTEALNISKESAESFHTSIIENHGQGSRWDIDSAKKWWRSGVRPIADDHTRYSSVVNRRTGSDAKAFVEQFTSVTGASHATAHEYGESSEYKNVERAINSFLDAQEYVYPPQQVKDQFVSGFVRRADASELTGNRFGFNYNYNLTRLDEAVAEYRRQSALTSRAQDLGEYNGEGNIEKKSRVTARTVIKLTQATNAVSPSVSNSTAHHVEAFDASIEGFNPRYLARWEDTSHEEQGRQIALARNIDSVEAWHWIVCPLPNTTDPDQYITRVFRQSHNTTEDALLNLTQQYNLHAYQEITGAGEATAREHLRMSDDIRTAIQYGFPGRNTSGRMDVLIHQHEGMRLTWRLRYQRLSQLRQEPDRVNVASEFPASNFGFDTKPQEHMMSADNAVTTGADTMSSDPAATAESIAGAQDGTVVDELAAAVGLVDISDDPSLEITRAMLNEATDSLL